MITWHEDNVSIHVPMTTSIRLVNQTSRQQHISACCSFNTTRWWNNLWLVKPISDTVRFIHVSLYGYLAVVSVRSSLQKILRHPDIQTTMTHRQRCCCDCCGWELQAVPMVVRPALGRISTVISGAARQDSEADIACSLNSDRLLTSAKEVICSFIHLCLSVCKQDYSRSNIYEILWNGWTQSRDRSISH